MKNTDELKLVKPTFEYWNQIIEYKESFIKNNEILHGCASLEDCSSFEEWIDFDNRLLKKFGKKYVKSEVFLVIRVNDNKLIGIVDFRKNLSDFLLNFGGNIGYSIAIDERGKGYGKVLLFLILKYCRKNGLRRVLLVCNKTNLASQKVILANKGVLENEVKHLNKLNNKVEILQRYWIDISKRYADYNLINSFIGDYNFDIKAINNEDFKGDLVFKYYNKVKVPKILYNNLNILDNKYKWIEFYDYNSNYKLTAIYDELNNIVEWYFDIADCIGKNFNLPYEDDLYLDVVLTKEGKVLLLDEDELDDAYKNRYISINQYNKAKSLSRVLIAKLNNNFDNVKKFTDKYLYLMGINGNK